MRIWLSKDNNKVWHGDQADDANLGDTITVAGVGYTCTFTDGAQAIFKETSKIRNSRDAVTGNVASSVDMPASDAANAKADTKNASDLQRQANDGALPNEAQQQAMADAAERQKQIAPATTGLNVAAPAAASDDKSKAKNK